MSKHADGHNVEVKLKRWGTTVVTTTITLGSADPIALKGFAGVYNPAATAPSPATKLTAIAMTGPTPRPTASRPRALVAALPVPVLFTELVVPVPFVPVPFVPVGVELVVGVGAPVGPVTVASAAYKMDDVYVTQLDDAGVRTDGSEVTTEGCLNVEMTPSEPVYTPTGSMLSESQLSNTPSW